MNIFISLRSLSTSENFLEYFSPEQDKDSARQERRLHQDILIQSKIYALAISNYTKCIRL